MNEPTTANAGSDRCPKCGAARNSGGFDCGSGYPWNRPPNELQRTDACRIAELEQEVARFCNPTPGDIESQAAAWSAVWKKLEEVGILSFYESSGLGRQRATEFIQHLASEVARLTAALAEERERCIEAVNGMGKHWSSGCGWHVLMEGVLAEIRRGPTGETQNG